MKYISILLITLILFSCNSNHQKPITLVRSFQNTGNLDSVYLYSDGHLVITEQPQKRRYFLISYSTREAKNTDGTIEGSLYLDWAYFPHKAEIDSMAYEMMPLKRICYQSVIINAIFEFKSEIDYNSFSERLKSSPITKTKNICK